MYIPYGRDIDQWRAKEVSHEEGEGFLPSMPMGLMEMTKCRRGRDLEK